MTSNRFVRVLVLAATVATACSSSNGARPVAKDTAQPAVDQSNSAEEVPAGKLVFVSGDRTGEHIYVSKSDGSGLRQIDHLPNCKQDPEWSPDGKRIAFRYMPNCDYSDNRIYVIDADGGNEVDITGRSGIDGNSPSWSPDGHELVFSGQRTRNDHMGIYLVNSDGSGRKRLTPPAMEAQYPAWSPDGTTIAFHVATSSGFDIYLMDADGSNRRPVVEGATQDEWPMWSPDSSEVVFGREGGQTSALYKIKADGSGDPTLLTDQAGVPANWAPGPWIVSNCLAADETIEICAVSPDGRGFVHLALNYPGEGGGFAAWKPDAQQ